jgi:hypothetical protein
MKSYASLIILLSLIKNTSSQNFLQEPTDSWVNIKSRKNIDLNEQPVIGILSQTLEDYMKTDPQF